MAYEAVYKYADKYASTWLSYTGIVKYHPIRGDGSDRVAVQQPGGVNHVFKLTNKLEWENIPLDDNGDPAGRIINPIPWEGDDEECSVKIKDGELESLRDEKGEIKFEKVLQWSLPRFGDNGDVSLFDWQTKRMRKYMTMLIKDRGYKPRDYNPDKDKTITGDHVVRFYGALLEKMLSKNSSNIQMFSTREIFDVVEPVKNSLTLDAMRDLTRCLHFADDWEEEEEEEWDEKYGVSKEEAPDTTARYQKKFSMVENAYNRR